MSVQFKIRQVQIPATWDEGKVKEFFDSHTSLKVHASPDVKDGIAYHWQSKRKGTIADQMVVKCADCEDVQLVVSMSDKKNRFKLNKCKSRGSADFKGGRPRKVIEVAEVETSQVKAE